MTRAANRQTVQWAIGVRDPEEGWVHEEEGRGRDRLQQRFSAIFTHLGEGQEIVVRRWNLDFHKRNAEEVGDGR